MSTKVETNYDFKQNEALNFVHQKLSSAPATPVEAQVYYNKTSKKQAYWNGSKWVIPPEIATDAEVSTGTAEDVAVNPKQLKSGLDTKQNSLNYTPENNSNKVSSISSSSTNTEYPTAKLLYDLLLLKAALASPEFTGTPKAPTATAGTNTTQIATTAFVKTAVDNAQSGIVKIETYNNASMTPTDGVCTWTVTHTLGTDDVICEVYEVSTGDKVIMDIEATSSTVLAIKMNAAAAVAANTYKAVIIGG